jgi:hypothetical protein
MSMLLQFVEWWAEKKGEEGNWDEIKKGEFFDRSRWRNDSGAIGGAEKSGC